MNSYTIRTNTLKTYWGDLAQALINRDVYVDLFDKQTKVSSIIYNNNQVPIGATPEYLTEHYMLQDVSIFFNSSYAINISI